MRAGSSLVVALVLTASACDTVPDLRFAGPDDGGPIASPQPDATLPQSDASPGLSEDATTAPGDDANAPAEDSAPGPPLPQDSATPPPASDGAPPPANGCPSSPPPGAICCGTVACKGNQQQCNCTECAFCSTQGGVCCPSMHPPPGYCASDVKDCH